MQRVLRTWGEASPAAGRRPAQASHWQSGRNGHATPRSPSLPHRHRSARRHERANRRGYLRTAPPRTVDQVARLSSPTRRSENQLPSCTLSVRRDDDPSPAGPMVRQRRVTNASVVLPRRPGRRLGPSSSGTRRPDRAWPRQIPQPPFGVQLPETSMAALRQSKERCGPVIRPTECLRRGQSRPQVVLGQIVTAEE